MFPWPAQNEWHSGMSPSPYELILTPSAVRKCYGCGDQLSDKYKKRPSNFIVRHVDKRVTGKDPTGKLTYSKEYSNTYYHPQQSHIKKKNPLFTGDVFLSNTLYSGLDDAQLKYMESLNLNVVIKWTELIFPDCYLVSFASVFSDIPWWRSFPRSYRALYEPTRSFTGVQSYTKT